MSIDKRIFTFLIVSYPILNRYAAPLPYLTLAEFLMMLIMIYFLFNQKKMKIVTIMLPLIGYFLLELFLLLIFMYKDVHFEDSFGSTLRLIYIYSIVCFFLKANFSLDMATKYIRYLGIIVSIYLFIQYIANYLGVRVSTYIPFLPIMGSNVDSIVLQKASYGLMFRGSSLFNEPAHLCTYLFVALIIELFYSHRKITFISIVYSVAILLSFSSTGLIIFVLIWIIFYIRTFQGSLRSIVNIAFFGGIAFTGIVYLAIRLNVFDFFINKVFSGQHSFEGIGSNSRFYALIRVFSVKRDAYNIIFGSGLYDMEGNYLPGFFRAYYCLGLVGEFLFLSFFWKMRRNHILFFPICMLIVYTILNIGTEMMFGEFSILYTSFIFGDCCDEFILKKVSK